MTTGPLMCRCMSALPASCVGSKYRAVMSVMSNGFFLSHFRSLLESVDCCEEGSVQWRKPDQERHSPKRSSPVPMIGVTFPLFRSFTGAHARSSMRWRSKSKFARPYICLLMHLSLLIFPSVCPLLYLVAKAARTASKSR